MENSTSQSGFRDVSLEMVLTEIFIRVRVHRASQNQLTIAKKEAAATVVRPLKGHETMVMLLLGVLGSNSEKFNLNDLHEAYFSKISLPTFSNTVNSLYDSGFIDKIANRVKSGFSIRLNNEYGIEKLGEIKFNISLSLGSVLESIGFSAEDKQAAKTYLVDLLQRYDRTIDNN